MTYFLVPCGVPSSGEAGPYSPHLLQQACQGPAWYLGRGKWEGGRGRLGGTKEAGTGKEAGIEEGGWRRGDDIGIEKGSWEGKEAEGGRRLRGEGGLEALRVGQRLDSVNRHMCHLNLCSSIQTPSPFSGLSLCVFGCLQSEGTLASAQHGGERRGCLSSTDRNCLRGPVSLRGSSEPCQGHRGDGQQ